MKRVLLLVFVWMAGSTPGLAQSVSGDNPAGTSRFPVWVNRQPILKFTPLALFDADNTIQAGIEIPFSDPRFSFQQEVGFGHSAFNVYPFEREEYPNKETWRFRTQLRKYYRINEDGAGYFAAEYLFKKNSIRQLKAVGMDCSSPGQCAYFEYRPVSLGRFVNAFHVKMGWQYYLSSRMNLDVYFGMGLRTLTVRNLGLPDVPPRMSSENFLFRADRPGRYGPLGSLNFGFHLGWVLAKRLPVGLGG